MSFDVEITRRLGTTKVGVQFRADKGLTVLVGPSGVGKTSVLNMISGLLRPDYGHVRIGHKTLFDSGSGINLAPELRRVGYVFQEPRLFPHLRVSANLLYGRRSDSHGFALEQVVAFLDIASLVDRWPRTLSGGEARRVAIGRALLSAPEFLLLDEPLSSLDRARREDVMSAIEHIRDQLNLPILMVTHDLREADRLGTRVIEM